MHNLPNFILAGFPKCGSTSLYYYLGAHPEVFVPKQKELHYFTASQLMALDQGKDDAEVLRFHIENLKDYQACYKEVGSEKAIGDISPSYANYPEVFESIKSTLGNDTKVLVMIRNPINRTYSNYLHLVREGREELSFYDALMAEESRKQQKYSDFWYYTANSMYADKIKALKNVFDSVMVINFEAFIKDVSGQMTTIYNFLGVDPSFVAENVDTQFNPGGVYKQNPITRFIFGQSGLKSAIKSHMHIPESFKKLKLKLINQYKEETPPIDSKAQEYLESLFEEEIEKLRTEHGVNTSLWLKKP